MNFRSILAISVYMSQLLLTVQINGFSYACRLRDMFDLPTLYNNESSLTCLVSQNQVMLMIFHLVAASSF